MSVDTCWTCGADLNMHKTIPTALLVRALRFYEGAPDGQYDHDVVVTLIRAELRRRDDDVEAYRAWKT